MKYFEYDLQCAVASYLDGLGLAGVKLAWSHPPNEGKHKPQYRVKQKKAGMKAGEPDCIIYLEGGVTLFIELKLAGNGLSQSQKDRHGVLRTLGFQVHTVTAKTPQDAVNQVEAILKKAGAV